MAGNRIFLFLPVQIEPIWRNGLASKGSAQSGKSDAGDQQHRKHSSNEWVQVEHQTPLYDYLIGKIQNNADKGAEGYASPCTAAARRTKDKAQ